MQEIQSIEIEQCVLIRFEELCELINNVTTVQCKTSSAKRFFDYIGKRITENRALTLKSKFNISQEAAKLNRSNRATRKIKISLIKH